MTTESSSLTEEEITRKREALEAEFHRIVVEADDQIVKISPDLGIVVIIFSKDMMEPFEVAGPKNKEMIKDILGKSYAYILDETESKN